MVVEKRSMNLSNSSPTPEPFSDALERLGGDRELLQTMAVIFVDDAPELLERLQHEVAQPDFPAAARTAHSLKGLIVTYDTDYAGVILQELVEALRDQDAPRVNQLMPKTQRVTEDLIGQCRALTE